MTSHSGRIHNSPPSAISQRRSLRRSSLSGPCTRAPSSMPSSRSGRRISSSISNCCIQTSQRAVPPRNAGAPAKKRTTTMLMALLGKRNQHYPCPRSTSESGPQRRMRPFSTSTIDTKSRGEKAKHSCAHCCRRTSIIAVDKRLRSVCVNLSFCFQSVSPRLFKTQMTTEPLRQKIWSVYAGTCNALCGHTPSTWTWAQCRGLEISFSTLWFLFHLLKKMETSMVTPSFRFATRTSSTSLRIPRFLP
eukprot:Rmarinus@m.5692